jgi:hypothetical protein
VYRRRRPPPWLIVMLTLVIAFDVLAVSVKYVAGRGSGLQTASVQGQARSVETAGRVRVNSLALNTGGLWWSIRAVTAIVGSTSRTRR